MPLRRQDLRQRRPLARCARFHLADRRPRAVQRRSRRRSRRLWRAPSRRGFHIPADARSRAACTRAGTDCIEAIFEFETAFGRANGVVRLVEKGGAWRAWTW